MKRVLDFFLSLAYVGYLPFLPGTFASLITSIFILALPPRSVFFDVFFMCLIIPLSVFSISSYRPEGRDPPHIVVDEFIGMYITMVGHRTILSHVLTGFILFRFFDIIKPYPVRKIEKLPGGWGIVADDIAAGIYANLSLHMVRILQWKLL